MSVCVRSLPWKWSFLDHVGTLLASLRAGKIKVIKDVQNIIFIIVTLFLKNAVLRVVTLCNSVSVRCFGGTYVLRLRDRIVSLTRSRRKLVGELHRTKRHYKPEDRNVQ